MPEIHIKKNGETICVFQNVELGNIVSDMVSLYSEEYIKTITTLRFESINHNKATDVTEINLK